MGIFESWLYKRRKAQNNNYNEIFKNKINQFNIAKIKLIQNIGYQWGRAGKWVIHRLEEWIKSIGTNKEEERYQKLLSTLKGVKRGEGISGSFNLVKETPELFKKIKKANDLINEYKNKEISESDMPKITEVLNNVVYAQVPFIGDNKTMQDIYEENYNIKNFEQKIPDFIEKLKSKFNKNDIWYNFLQIDTVSNTLIKSLTDMKLGETLYAINNLQNYLKNIEIL